MHTQKVVIAREDFESHPLFARLLTLHDIPEQMYLQGELPSFSYDSLGRLTPRILTIVGSRKNTSYAVRVLEKLLASLQGQPVIILSGLALGIDGLAHSIALKNNLITYAIPGSGLSESVLYPRGHVHLARDILEHGGVLLSELDYTTPSAPWTFPARNRIMAALSDAVLVIEAEEKSGTLITARMALELGKEIGAVPGEIFSPTSYGTNMLIHDGAHAITEEEDLFDLLGLSYEQTQLLKDAPSLSEEEQKLLALLTEPMEKDVFLIKSELPLTTFLMLFSSLEMKGCIQETFGEVRRMV